MSQLGRVGAGGGWGGQETVGGALSVFQCSVLQRSGLSPQSSERGSQGTLNFRRVGLLTLAPVGDVRGGGGQKLSPPAALSAGLWTDPLVLLQRLELGFSFLLWWVSSLI